MNAHYHFILKAEPIHLIYCTPALKTVFKKFLVVKVCPIPQGSTEIEGGTKILTSKLQHGIPTDDGTKAVRDQALVFPRIPHFIGIHDNQVAVDETVSVINGDVYFRSIEKPSIY